MAGHRAPKPTNTSGSYKKENAFTNGKRGPVIRVPLARHASQSGFSNGFANKSIGQAAATTRLSLARPFATL